MDRLEKARLEYQAILVQHLKNGKNENNKEGKGVLRTYKTGNAGGQR